MKREDITGQQFGPFFVMEYVGCGRYACRCECGNEMVREGTRLRREKRTRCDCARIQAIAEASSKRSRHRLSNTPTYRTWQKMKSRCHCPTSDWYPEYGGRGILVCESWREDFNAFLADMGERPPGKTLDRIDNDKGYEPGNCRWATPKQQTRNRRVVVIDDVTAMQIRWLHSDGGYNQREIREALELPKHIVRSVVYGCSWLPDEVNR